jgi:hypothetical protein
MVHHKPMPVAHSKFQMKTKIIEYSYTLSTLSHFYIIFFLKEKIIHIKKKKKKKKKKKMEKWKKHQK